MTPAAILIRVVRALRHAGAVHHAGAVLEVSALDAAQLLYSSRAELVDTADLQSINDAIARENARLVGPRRDNAAKSVVLR
jgi:hypothetical protein